MASSTSLFFPEVSAMLGNNGGRRGRSPIDTDEIVKSDATYCRSAALKRSRQTDITLPSCFLKYTSPSRKSTNSASTENLPVLSDQFLAKASNDRTSWQMIMQIPNSTIQRHINGRLFGLS